MGLVAALGLVLAPLLPWVGVSQRGFLFIAAQSRQWTALDDLPEINNVPGWLALGSGVIALGLITAGLLLGRRTLAAAAALPALSGLAACGLFVLQLKNYQREYENDLVARVAQAVLDIKGGLEAGWFLALVCGLVLLGCTLGQMVRKSR
ncbi:hypothetical protein GCM10010468_68710 [Actinocorallia longicatena]|uniref:Uncharacterized protein n=1 Tax=Actinocorallia longicatena TaxID=111803 RepID=A0ABP6QKN5_9ACTN